VLGFTYFFFLESSSYFVPRSIFLRKRKSQTQETTEANISV